jgi:hypothetical protein
MIRIPAARFHMERQRLTIEVPSGLLAMVQHTAKTCAAGYVRVDLARPGRPRTTGEDSQNHHINGHIAEIASETGQDFDTVKLALKKMAVSRGYPFRTEKITGEVVPYSETELDTVQAGILIDTIHQFAAEFGIRLMENLE